MTLLHFCYVAQRRLVAVEVSEQPVGRHYQVGLIGCPYT